MFRRLLLWLSRGSLVPAEYLERSISQMVKAFDALDETRLEVKRLDRKIWILETGLTFAEQDIISGSAIYRGPTGNWVRPGAPDNPRSFPSLVRLAEFYGVRQDQLLRSRSFDEGGEDA